MLCIAVYTLWKITDWMTLLGRFISRSHLTAESCAVKNILQFIPYKAINVTVTAPAMLWMAAGAILL